MTVAIVPGQNFDGFVQGFAAMSNVVQSAQKHQMEQQRLALEGQYLQNKIMMDQQLAPLQLQSKQLEIETTRKELENLDLAVLERRASFGDRIAAERAKAKHAEALIGQTEAQTELSRFTMSQAKAWEPFKMQELQRAQEAQDLQMQVTRAQLGQIEDAKRRQQLENDLLDFNINITKQFAVVDKLRGMSPGDLQVVIQDPKSSEGLVRAAQTMLNNPKNPLRDLMGPSWEKLPAEAKAGLMTNVVMGMAGGNLEPQTLAVLRDYFYGDEQGLQNALELTGASPKIRQAVNEALQAEFNNMGGQGQGPLKSYTAPDWSQGTGEKPNSKSTVSNNGAWSDKQIKMNMEMFMSDMTREIGEVAGNYLPGVNKPVGDIKQSDWMVEQKRRYDQEITTATMSPRNKQERDQKSQALTSLRRFSKPELVDDLIRMDSDSAYPHKAAAFSLLRNMLLKSSNKSVVIQQASETGLLYELSDGDRKKIASLANKYQW